MALLREPARELSGTARVVDGDTLAFGAARLRLAGLDAPELDQTCGPPEKPVACGRLARDALARLASGPVTCRVSGRDKYGRELGRCAAGGSDVGAELVRDGWAVSYGGYHAEEGTARAAGRGIWAGPFDEPAAWRRLHPREAGR